MQLQVKCSKCRLRIRVPQKATDRSDFVQNYGDSVKVTCSKCGTLETYHVNEIKAVNRITRRLSAIILVMGTGLIVYVLRGFFFKSFGPYEAIAVFGTLLIPSWFYYLINKQAVDTVQRFNKYYV